MKNVNNYPFLMAYNYLKLKLQNKSPLPIQPTENLENSYL